MSKSFHAPTKEDLKKDAKLLMELKHQIKDGSISDDNFEKSQQEQMDYFVQEQKNTQKGEKNE